MRQSGAAALLPLQQFYQGGMEVALRVDVTPPHS